MTERALIIGIGNELCGDDVAVSMVCGRLESLLNGSVSVAHCAGPVWDILYDPDHHAPDLVVFILVSEQTPGFPAGDWCRIDFPDEHTGWGLAYQHLRLAKEVRVPASLALAQYLSSLGTRVLVYVLSGCDLQLGASSCSQIREACPRLTAQIERDVMVELDLRPADRLEPSLSAVS